MQRFHSVMKQAEFWFLVLVPIALMAQLKQQLRDFFLDLHNAGEGNRILNNLGIDKFVVVPNDIYDSVREMKTKLER